jgi:protein gp37
MGDLFHESIPDAWIDRVFAVMALAPQHTFQVLTKRSARMRAYVGNLPNRDDLVAKAAVWIWGGKDTDAVFGGVMRAVRQPLPNIWLGVSAEDQRRADERVPDLLATPAAVRFVSAEPLLGPIDFSGHCDGWSFIHSLQGQRYHDNPDGPSSCQSYPKLDWIIVGGESGSGARPMHPDWARSIRDQCAAAGVPFFFKQWGEWAPSTPEAAYGNPRSGWRCLAGHPHVAKASELYPEAGAVFIEHMGKARAGRLLDGVTHDAFPGQGPHPGPLPEGEGEGRAVPHG